MIPRRTTSMEKYMVFTKHQLRQLLYKVPIVMTLNGDVYITSRSVADKIKNYARDTKKKYLAKVEIVKQTKVYMDFSSKDFKTAESLRVRKQYEKVRRLKNKKLKDQVILYEKIRKELIFAYRKKTNITGSQFNLELGARIKAANTNNKTSKSQVKTQVKTKEKMKYNPEHKFQLELNAQRLNRRLQRDSDFKARRKLNK